MIGIGCEDENNEGKNTAGGEDISNGVLCAFNGDIGETDGSKGGVDVEGGVVGNAGNGECWTGIAKVDDANDDGDENKEDLADGVSL
jgi:hypothetical protein